MARQDYLRAVVAYRRLTEIAPKNPAGYYGLGMALKARNRNNEAIASLNRALELYQEVENTEQAERVALLIEELENDN